jgi:hypothetical protein
VSKEKHAWRAPRGVLTIIVSAVLLVCFWAIGGVGFATSSASAQEYQYDKVTICHRTGSGKSHEITVSRNALPAHLAHGDRAGACTP